MVASGCDGTGLPHYVLNTMAQGQTRWVVGSENKTGAALSLLRHRGKTMKFDHDKSIYCIVLQYTLITIMRSNFASEPCVMPSKESSSPKRNMGRASQRKELDTKFRV